MMKKSYREFLQDIMEELLPNIEKKLKERNEEGIEIYPNGLVFNAFNQHELNDLKVVILGQD